MTSLDDYDNLCAICNEAEKDEAEIAWLFPENERWICEDCWQLREEPDPLANFEEYGEDEEDDENDD